MNADVANVKCTEIERRRSTHVLFGDVGKLRRWNVTTKPLYSNGHQQTRLQNKKLFNQSINLVLSGLSNK